MPLAVGLVAAGVEGLLLLRLFVIFHDHVHGALLPRSAAARRLFRVVGVALLSPVAVWRSSHDFHHRHAGQTFGAQIGSFPVMTTAQWAAASPARRFAYRAARHPLTMVFAAVTVFGWGMCLAPFLRAPRKHADGALAILLHAALAAGLIGAFGWTAWLLPVALPVAIASALGAYLFYAQHNFPGVRLQVRISDDPVRAAMEASSHLRTGAVLAWFTANIGYHPVHHVNARVPFYRLPEAMAAIPALRAPVTTSLRPADVAACLRLALWDTETETLVELPR